MTWCELDALQDAVCGSGYSRVESRDDDAHRLDINGMEYSSGDKRFIDDYLRTFSNQLDSPSKTGLWNKSGGIGPPVGSPATTSKSESAKGSSSSASQGVDKLRYQYFMDSVDFTAKQHGAQSVPVADLYVEMGVECTGPNADAKSKELALLLFEEAFSIYQAKSGDSHEQTVDCRIHLGRTYQCLERYDEALDCFCMAVYMREALQGEHHPSVSDIWVLIASVHHAKNKLELALKASAKALTGYRNAYGDKHHTVIGVLKTIAQIHIEMGNDDKAVDIQKYVRLHSPRDR